MFTFVEVGERKRERAIADGLCRDALHCNNNGQCGRAELVDEFTIYKYGCISLGAWLCLV